RFRVTKLVAYRAMAWNASISHILMKAISIFVLACGTWFVIYKSMTFGEFMAFVILSNIFLQPIQKINSVIETYPKGLEGFRRYQELLDTPADVEDSENVIDIAKVKGEISYRNVDFSYDKEESLL